MKKYAKQVIMTVLFVLLILTLTIFNMLKPTKAFSETENRPLQLLPQFSFEELFNGKYGVNFEKYTTDQFIGRDKWVEIKNDIDFAIQKKDSKGVYFGQDGYLFEKLTDSTLNKEQLDINSKRLSAFVEKYSQKLGKDRVRAIIAPNSFEILDDKLPKFAPTIDEEYYLSQMKKDMGDNFINLVDVFKDNKNSDNLYYKTDHHWTSDGAYLAYTEWCKSLNIKPMDKDEFTINVVSEDFYGTYHSKARYSGIKPDIIKQYVPKEDFTYDVDFDLGKEKSNSLYSEEFLQKKDKYSYFLDSNHSVIDIKTNVQNDKKLLVIKDSYANSFVPFAVNHFSEVFVVDFRYYKLGMSKFIEENGITDVLVLYNFSTFTTDANTGAMIL